jgi:hypothetical protein
MDKITETTETTVPEVVVEAVATPTTPETAPEVKTKAERIEYGFALNFPARFTMKVLYGQRHGKVKYITLYARVKNALAEGLLVKDGFQTPKTKTRGRRQIIFKRVDAKKKLVSAAPVDAVEAPVEPQPEATVATS